MSDRAKKISELTVVTSASANDRVLLIQNTSGNAVTVTITTNNYFSSRGNLKNVKTANINYTLTANDNGSVIPVNNTATITVTVPVSLPTGFNCQIFKVGTGNVVVGNAAGVTLHSKSGAYTVSDQWGTTTVLVYSANTVLVSGDV